MKQVVLINPALRGLEYGMLRDFEDEIVRVTGAEKVIAPSRSLPSFIGGRLAHGTRYSGARRWVPKEHYELKADVLWVVLMGPENFTLDMYRGWDRHVGIKILYLFDTFDAQINSIRRVLRTTKWDFVSTAFFGAERLLEEQTDQEWHLVRQAVNLNRFYPAPVQDRVIDFSSYGRRVDRIHEQLKKYCALTGKYYDYTTAASIQPDLDPSEHYEQYAWHLRHSLFDFCWPVEVTHPDRAKSYSPITCRWFEGSASGAVILGRAPSEPGFSDLFGANAVIDIDPNAKDVPDILRDLWEAREEYLEAAALRRARFSRNWSWEARIRQIQEAVGLPLKPSVRDDREHASRVAAEVA